jgi:hypothetical protein
LYLYSWWSILNYLGEFITLNPLVAAPKFDSEH